MGHAFLVFFMAVGWGDTQIVPVGWILKMLVAGETLNIFLLTGISNINIFFIKKKNDVVVDSNIYD